MHASVWAMPFDSSCPNITATLKLSVTLDEREIMQTLSGWIILDLEKKLGKFITNQQLMFLAEVVPEGS